jgi:YD repeat-containing protein
VTYYGDAETRTNPCGTNSTPIIQGGRPRLSTAADPDGIGTQQPIVHENVYDINGRVVATRTGTEPWNCITYDTRGRPVTITHPAFGTTPTRTVTYNYSVQNNPLKYSVNDPTGTITTTIDLLGRTISTTDTSNTTTITTYDQAGRPTTTTTTTTTGTLPALGATYDAAGRTETVTLGGALLADPAYDTAGRLASVSYPTGTGKAGNATSGAFTYDTKGRPAKVTWTGPTGLLSSDQITARDGLGRITNFKTDTIDPYTTGVNYVYDRGGRLTTARTAGHISTYSYGTSTCAAPAIATAGKNTNRTQVTDNGVTVTNCYDSADRLISSSDPAVGTISYDSHGNTTTILVRPTPTTRSIGT